ncbi:ABC transporter ATP-binding protein [Bacillus solitudinis]|uniref:ABC transporter ATP-binding protein n=1 Tax=Bacillus solitudinis TaxID=2014074 RepID=UPI000C23C30D|nr:ABC transporter ATP-binding protein [Bacillus solitudinis]
MVKPLSLFQYKDCAKKVAVVGQVGCVPLDFPVLKSVLMGRNPHKHFLNQETKIDCDIALDALKQVGLEGYEHRRFATLSDGEKQCVMMARTIAQEPSFFILDEPMKHLDIHQQLHILDLLKRLKITVLTTMQDINLASSYCERFIVMQDGRLVANGSPNEIPTKQLVEEVFQVEATIWTHPLTLKAQVIYVSPGMKQGTFELQLKRWLQS